MYTSECVCVRTGAKGHHWQSGLDEIHSPQLWYWLHLSSDGISRPSKHQEKIINYYYVYIHVHVLEDTKLRSPQVIVKMKQFCTVNISYYMH